MTSKQRITMMADWWPAACQAQGWPEGDRALRLRVLGVAVSFPKGHFRNLLDCLAAIQSGDPLARPIQSASDLNPQDDVDRVKVLLQFLSENIDAAHELDHPEAGDARRTRHVIVQERLRCLALYPLAAPMGRAGAQALLEKLLRDFVNHGRKFEQVTLDDLSEAPQFYRRKGSSELHEGPSQLQRVLMRLDALLNTNDKATGRKGYRVQAGHSLHDMKLAAGLPCHCATFCRKKVRRPAARTATAPAVAEPVAVGVAGDPDWTV